VGDEISSVKLHAEKTLRGRWGPTERLVGGAATVGVGGEGGWKRGGQEARNVHQLLGHAVRLTRKKTQHMLF
jgi:hypothetical protein